MGFLMSSDRREYYSFKDIILFNKSCSDFSISPSLDARAVNLAITSLSFSLEEKVTSSFVKAGRFGLFIKLKNSPFEGDMITHDYIAPESIGKPPSQLGREQDIFALSVIIFQLFQNLNLLFFLEVFYIFFMVLFFDLIPH